jgi:eukaryotic-like serine/threonine-protein kinase
MDPGLRTLAGRYQLEAVIGRGGMSTVYRATDLVLGRRVAVKVLLAELADEDPSYVARFQREAQAAAALPDSAVVTVYDTGSDDGARFIVMEYVSGRSLSTILAAREPLPVGEALRIAERVASALSAAHAAGILHRDIKPANVMLADDGAVKVLDFGIARRLDATTLTQAASIVGTAAYMSPERALGKPGDARSDIYSLGCLLYAMLAGAAPFGGEVAAVILHQQINSEPRPPSELRHGVPAALDLLVLAMLAKDPDERPQSAAKVRDELAALAGAGRQTPTVSPPPKPVEPTLVRTAATARIADTATAVGTAATRVLGTPASWSHRRRAVVLALATGVFAIAVIALASSGGGGSGRTGRASIAARSHTSTTPPPTNTGTLAQTTATQLTATTAPAATGPTAPAPHPAPPGPVPGAPPGHGAVPPGHAKGRGGPGGPAGR